MSMYSNVLALLVLIQLIHSNAFDSKEGGDFLQYILKEAEKIPIANFDSDPVVLQNIDSLNGITTYKDPFNDNVLYERVSNDEHKDIIVLSWNDVVGQEGVAPSEQKTFIVLRRALSNDTTPHYYQFIGYILNAKFDEQDTFVLGNNHYKIEWSVWDDHVLKNIKYGFSYTLCIYSVIGPCGFNKTTLLPELQSPSKPKDFKPEKENKQSSSENQKPFVTEENYDSDLYTSFFDDLKPNRISGKAWALGKLYDLIAGSLDVVGFTFCGISGALLGQCDGYDPDVGYIKSSIAGGVVTDDGKVLGAGSKGTNAGLLGLLAGEFASIGGEDPRLMEHYDDLRKKREAKEINVADQLLNSEGWKTQFQKTPVANVTLSHEDAIFFGLGNCPFRKDKIDPNILKQSKDFIALRDENALIVDGVTLVLNPKSPLPSTPKLNWKDEQRLTNLMEITAFTKTFKNDLKAIDSVIYLNKLGNRISRSIRFIEKVGLKFIQLTLSKANKHLIRLCRHLIQLLKKVFTKLEEDGDKLDKCEGNCDLDKEINFQEKITIIGLIHFIIHGLTPLLDQSHDKENVEKIYSRFFQKNEEAIVAAVDLWQHTT